MNTLDDLRTTLASHAPTDDAALRGRTASVHARVRVVRRRRRASVVVGSVVAAVVAGIALPRAIGVHHAEIADVPDAVIYGGFEYRFQDSSGVGGDGAGRVEEQMPIVFDPSPRRTVVVLAAQGLDGGTATVVDSSGQPVERLVDDGVGRPIPLPGEPGEPTRLTLVVDHAGPHAEVDVARYRRTSTMPDGVVDATGSTVFRQQVGGRRLDTAAFLDGRAQTTLTFRGALADVRIAAYCTVPGGASDRRGPFFFVSVDGNGFSGGACGDPASEDAVGDWSWQQEDHDRLHTVRVWTATAQGQAAAIVPGAVVGVAVYRAGETVDVHGSTIDRIVEFGGQTWQLDDTVESEPGNRRIVATWNGLRDHLLVGYATERTRRVTTGGSVEGGGHVDMTAESVADTHASSLSGVVLPGDRASYTVSWPARYADASGAILVYRPLD